MNAKTLFDYLWRLLLCGIAYLFGLVVSGMILAVLGLDSPSIPEGTNSTTISFWFFIGSVVLAFALSFISSNLHTTWQARILILFELTLIFGVVGMVIESSLFMTTGAVSSWMNSFYTILNFLLPNLFLTSVVAYFFSPTQQDESCVENLCQYFKAHRFSAWSWRILFAIIAYPLVYFLFGLIVQPFIHHYYTSGQFELISPTWGQLIPIQLVRSSTFLISTLPVIIWWRSTHHRLWLALGFSIFILTAFMAVITSYWFPWQLRLFHGLELLADGFVYSGLLVMLFRRHNATLMQK